METLPKLMENWSRWTGPRESLAGPGGVAPGVVGSRAWLPWAVPGPFCAAPTQWHVKSRYSKEVIARLS